MILDLLAGFMIICLLILLAATVSWSITYWFVSIPLFILWLIWYTKREKERQRNLSPAAKARQEADYARWLAGVNAEKAAKARRKAMYR